MVRLGWTVPKLRVTACLRELLGLLLLICFRDDLLRQAWQAAPVPFTVELIIDSQIPHLNNMI